jgi:hypothetical protein
VQIGAKERNREWLPMNAIFIGEMMQIAANRAVTAKGWAGMGRRYRPDREG